MGTQPTNIKGFLKRVPLFKKFSDDGISTLISSFITIQLPRYAIIYLQNDSTDGSYIVKSGLVKTTKLLHSGEECTLELFFPGETFGMRALFGPNKGLPML
jgi:CRP-like cAMP-binding protein